jgi:hypothetical protein
MSTYIKKHKAIQTSLSSCYSIFGFIVGILLTFSILAVWQELVNTRKDVLTEGSHLNDIIRDAEGLKHTDIIEKAKAYGKSVVCEEWPLLKEGYCERVAIPGTTKIIKEVSHPNTIKKLNDLWEAVYKLNSTNHTQQLLEQNIINNLSKVNTFRQQRLLLSQIGLPAILWAILIIGISALIIFPWFIAKGTPIKVRLICITTVAVIALGGLFVLYNFEYPFRRLIFIDSDAFDRTFL